MSENEVKRQAIKQAQQSEILSGIVNNESKTYTFTKELSVCGKKQSGTFIAKYIGIAGRLKLGTIRAKLLEGAPSQSVDALTDDIAYMVAYLTVALTTTPSWFNYEDLDDIVDLRNLYMEVFQFMQSFRGNHEQDTNARDSADASSQETMGDK